MTQPNPDPIRDRVLELTHDADRIKATIAILLKQAYDAGKSRPLDELPELMTVLERGIIPDSWVHDNTAESSPLHAQAAATRQTIAQLVEANADGAAIALLANHLEAVEALIQMKENAEQAENIRDRHVEDFLKRREERRNQF